MDLLRKTVPLQGCLFCHDVSDNGTNMGPPDEAVMKSLLESQFS